MRCDGWQRGYNEGYYVDDSESAFWGWGAPATFHMSLPKCHQHWSPVVFSHGQWIRMGLHSTLASWACTVHVREAGGSHSSGRTVQGMSGFSTVQGMSGFSTGHVRVQAILDAPCHYDASPLWLHL